MKANLQQCPRIALQIEKNRAHGRALLKGVAGYALEHTGWRLELVDPQKLTSARYVSQFDGLIVRVMDDATAGVLVKSGKPVVDTYGRCDDNPMPSIRLDDARIAEMAYACFEEHRYRSLAYCGFDGVRFSDARGDAFKAVAERGGRCASVYGGAAGIGDMFFRDEKTDVPDGKSLGRWLEGLPRPTAIFCCNDLRAVHVLNVCADLGIDVPGDIAVMGVDNDVLLCSFAKPSLSSIDTDPVSLGRKAAEMLDMQMAGRAKLKRKAAVPMPPRLWAPLKVVERMSTDSYQFKTPWLEEAVRYIRRNIASGVSAADVVRHMGYSHPTVSKAFAAEVGHTVKKEILSQRLRMACSLLKEENCPLGEIAKRCGYPSPQYFSYCFAETFKMPPDSWRKKFRFQKT